MPRNVMIKITLTAVMLMSCCACTLFAFWGYNQNVSIHLLEQKVYIGMSIDDLEYSLGKVHGSLSSRIEAVPITQTNNNPYSLEISTNGLGSMLSPQHEITIYLSQNKTVASGRVKSIYRISEEYRTLNLNLSRYL